MRGRDWVLAALFGAAVFAAGAASGALAWWLAPAIPSVCAAAALARARHWKLRGAKNAAREREALRSMAFEAANACNAIRLNLIGFREVNAAAASPEHLDEIARGADRMAAAIEKAGVFSRRG